MNCPSCNRNGCNGDCSSCCNTETKTPLYKRLYAKFFRATDANGCDVTLDGSGFPVSDGKKVWLADGSEDKPIKVESLQQLTDAFDLMGIDCAGVIGKVSSNEDEPVYLQISKDGLTTASEGRSDVLYEKDKIEAAFSQSLAVWQADGTHFRLSRLRGPNEDNECCDSRYYLVFDCEGALEYREAIAKLGDLIANSSNTGDIVLSNNCEGKLMELNERYEDEKRYSLFFVEKTESVTLDCDDADCQNLQVVTLSWYKTSTTRQLATEVSDQDTNAPWCIPTWHKDGDSVELRKTLLAEGEVIVGDKNGNPVKTSLETLVTEITDAKEDALAAGAIQLFNPVVLATASSTIDLTNVLTVPVCAGSLWGLFQGTVHSGGGGVLAEASVNGTHLVASGSNEGSGYLGRTNSNSAWIKIDNPESLNIVITSLPTNNGNIPEVRLNALACQ